jgi:hypothetical protein
MNVSLEPRAERKQWNASPGMNMVGNQMRLMLAETPRPNSVGETRQLQPVPKASRAGTMNRVGPRISSPHQNAPKFSALGLSSYR